MKKFLTVLNQKVYRYGVLGAVTLLSSPSLTFAQQAGKDSVQGYLVMIGLFINNTILPLIFTIALLFFLVNAARYFIFQGSDEGGQDKARRMALYGIGAFVFLVSIWGIVNMLVGGLGIQRSESLCPDYLDNWCNYSGRGGLNSPSEGTTWRGGSPLLPDGSLGNEIPTPTPRPQRLPDGSAGNEIPTPTFRPNTLPDGSAGNEIPVPSFRPSTN